VAIKADPSTEQLKARVAQLEASAGRLTKAVLVQMLKGLQDDDLFEAYYGMRDVIVGKPDFHKYIEKAEPIK
jgi:phosphoglycolate phosphatase-like HAD superfamily hydrolase